MFHIIILTSWIACCTAAMMQVAAGQEEQSTTDRFQTVSLASEVFNNGLKMTVHRKWLLPKTDVSRDRISRSCSCLHVGDGQRWVGGPDDDGSAALTLNQEVQLTMTTGRVMDSQSQSANIKLENHRISYVWNCRIFADITSDTFEITVDPRESDREKTNGCCLNLTFRSRNEFEENSQPRFISETSFLNSVQFETLRKYTDEFGIHVMKGVTFCDMVESPQKGVEKNLLHVIHPHAPDNVNEINPYRKLTIPVYVDYPDVEQIVVNFGVAPVGKELRRTLDDYKLDKRIVNDVRNRLSDPFFLEAGEDGTSKDSRFSFVFRPSKSGSYSREFKIGMPDGNSLDFQIKGKCYDPSRRNIP